MTIRIGWESIDPELRAIIERVCTPKQIELVRLMASGYTVRKMARALDRDPKSVRDMLTRAHRRIQQEVAAMRGIS